MGFVCIQEQTRSLIHPWLGLGVGAKGSACSLERRESLIHPQLGLGVGAVGSACSLERRESLIHPQLGLGVGAMGSVCSLEQRESLIHPQLGLGVGAMGFDLCLVQTWSSYRQGKNLDWIKADYSVGLQELQEYQDSHFVPGFGLNQKILESAQHPQFHGPKSRIVRLIRSKMTKIKKIIKNSSSFSFVVSLQK